MQYINLPLYYQINRSMHRHHDYDELTINNWYPFERDINISMINMEQQAEQQEPPPMM